MYFLSKKLYFISISGGKDSTSTIIYMLKNYPRHKLRFVFADTGWEHPITYEYIKYLESRFKIRILTVKSKRYDGMEALCIAKKMFPNRIKKFCTTELKIIPIKELYDKYKAKGYKIVSVVGVRAEESDKRKGENLWKTNFTNVPKHKEWSKLKKIKKSKAVKAYFSKENSVIIYQPIVYWTTQEVYNYHFTNKVELNPLYKMGCSRVGCYPCINANQFEIGMLDDVAIQKVKDLEVKVSAVTNNPKHATFFYSSSKPIEIEKIVSKYKYNGLGLNLGCINPYGACE